MSIRQDVFGLEQIYQLQIEGNWSVRSDVWLTPSPFFGSWEYGYFGGGAQPARVSTVNRIDYSNDTASASTKGPLTYSAYGMGATSAAENGLPQ